MSQNIKEFSVQYRFGFPAPAPDAGHHISGPGPQALVSDPVWFEASSYSGRRSERGWVGLGEAHPGTEDYGGLAGKSANGQPVQAVVCTGCTETAGQVAEG